MKKCRACKKKFNPKKLQEPWASSGLCGPCVFEYIDDEATVAEDWVTRGNPAAGIDEWLDRREAGNDGD